MIAIFRASSIVFALYFMGAAIFGEAFAETNFPLDEEDQINLRCLKRAYPQIRSLVKNGDGSIDLLMDDGKLSPYKSAVGGGDVFASMRQIYPLEPNRPDIDDGFAPGRDRPYDLFDALYGSMPSEVQKNLKTVALPRGKASLNKNAARALASIVPELDSLAREHPELRKYLKVDGGYYWRNIAGEDRRSAHSYGIAIDLGAASAPYWRWAKKPRHPLQKTYPRELVEVMEKAGFIWGGKWDKYDLMHFEYRPELICKSRELLNRELIK